MCGLTLTREAFINCSFYRFQISPFLNYWQHWGCAHFSGLSCLNIPWVMLSVEGGDDLHTLPVGRAVWFRPYTWWSVNKLGSGVLILSLRGKRHINDHSDRETPTNSLYYKIPILLFYQILWHFIIRAFIILCWSKMTLSVTYLAAGIAPKVTSMDRVALSPEKWFIHIYSLAHMRGAVTWRWEGMTFCTGTYQIASIILLQGPDSFFAGHSRSSF